MADRAFQFVKPNGAIDSISFSEIEKMTIPQFLQFEGNLLNVRRDRRHDVVVYERNTIVSPNHAKTLFRKGMDEEENFATSANSYKKNQIHTNMQKGGEFEQGDMVIVKNLEVELPVFGGKPTTKSTGVVTNAKATFPATFDPALAAYAWLNQTNIQFRRGKTVIFEGLAINFVQKAGLWAAYGANSGAYVQNGHGGDSLMPNVQCLKGGDDFSVVVQPLADFDLTTANGLDMEWQTKIVLETVELRRNYE